MLGSAASAGSTAVATAKAAHRVTRTKEDLAMGDGGAISRSGAAVPMIPTIASVTRIVRARSKLTVSRLRPIGPIRPIRPIRPIVPTLHLEQLPPPIAVHPQI